MDVSRYDYGVNDIGQRVTIERSGSAFTAAATETASYNARGEVVQTTIPNQLDRYRNYNFDGIGNRTAATEGTVETSYIPNAVNEYATVGGTAQTHDDDGNLTDNGTFTYKWGAENRLLSVADKASSNVVIGYKYDYHSCRIERNRSEGKTNWIYHGWNPCGQYLDGALDRTYTWGNDLSGSKQGAGGVGGLLAVTAVISGSHYYPTFDGNGNISEYINDQQETVAHYEYDAFGNNVASTGIVGDYFEHRFSTKQIDEETGFYYYGYRYYNPATGRWPSRDPIAENGGMNLYGFVGNDSTNKIDYLGLDPTCPVCCSNLQEAYDRARAEMNASFNTYQNQQRHTESATSIFNLTNALMQNYEGDLNAANTYIRNATIGLIVGDAIGMANAQTARQNALSSIANLRPNLNTARTNMFAEKLQLTIDRDDFIEKGLAFRQAKEALEECEKNKDPKCSSGQ